MSSRNGKKVITDEVRFSYLHVFEPMQRRPDRRRSTASAS